MITIEDYITFHNEHCPRYQEEGGCGCWLPGKVIWEAEPCG